MKINLCQITENMTSEASQGIRFFNKSFYPCWMKKGTGGGQGIRYFNKYSYPWQRRTREELEKGRRARVSGTGISINILTHDEEHDEGGAGDGQGTRYFIVSINILTHDG